MAVRPNEIREKLAQYTAQQLTAFYRGLNSTAEIDRQIKYAGRAKVELVAEQAAAETLALKALQKKLEKELAGVKAKLKKK